MLFRFWEMLAYLANTLIFIMVGVVIMEKALNSLDEYDLFLLVVGYFGITVIRFVAAVKPNKQSWHAPKALLHLFVCFLGPLKDVLTCITSSIDQNKKYTSCVLTPKWFFQMNSFFMFTKTLISQITCKKNGNWRNQFRNRQTSSLARACWLTNNGLVSFLGV